MPKTSEVVGQRGKENIQSKFVKLQMPEKECEGWVRSCKLMTDEVCMQSSITGLK